MVITTPNGIAMVDLETRAVEKIVDGRAHIIMVGRKTGRIYFGETKIATARPIAWSVPLTQPPKRFRKS